MADVTRCVVFRRGLCLRRLFSCLQLLILGIQLFRSFTPLRIKRNATDRAYLLTLWLRVMTYTLSAFMRINLINFRPHVNGVIRAFGFADIAIDAIVCNHQGHVVTFMCYSAYTRLAAPANIYFKTCSRPVKRLFSSTSGLLKGKQILTHHRQTWRSHALSYLK